MIIFRDGMDRITAIPTRDDRHPPNGIGKKPLDQRFKDSNSKAHAAPAPEGAAFSLLIEEHHVDVPALPMRAIGTRAMPGFSRRIALDNRQGALDRQRALAAHGAAAERSFTT